MCWAEYGDPDGTPVFLLHGNPGSRLAWGAMPHAPFVDGVRIVAPLQWLVRLQMWIMSRMARRKRRSGDVSCSGTPNVIPWSAT